MNTLLTHKAGVQLAGGVLADVELHRSAHAAPEPDVFAAMVVVEDPARRFAVVYSPRRGEWGSPGGRREGTESVRDCAVREVAEETGLRLAAVDLVVWGYERFAARPEGLPWPEDGACLQVFRAHLPTAAADLRTAAADALDPQWVDGQRFRELCGDRFWWPLVETVVTLSPRSGHRAWGREPI